ncbi:MAG TPA: hypothetical protein ENG93_01305 [Nitrospirae bacterium]|nr:hypothetical protein [Nitrospirota bacterium]
MNAFIESNTLLIQLLLYTVIIVAVFLLLREVVCWYWKINEISLVLKDIRDSINKLIDKEPRDD